MPDTPSPLVSSGYAETLKQIREAFERRLTNQTNRLTITPSFHRGMPNLKSLPDEQVGVWLDVVEMKLDPEGSTMNASCYQSTWYIAVVGRAEGNDSFGARSSLVEDVWAEITTSLTETNEDLGMDGAAEYIQQPQWKHGRGAIGGNDQRIQVFEGTVLASHLLEIVRSPP